MAKVLRTVAKFNNPFLADQEAALQHLAGQHRGRARDRSNDENDDASDPNFSYIVIRPSVLMRDGPSMRKLSASRSVRNNTASLVFHGSTIVWMHSHKLARYRIWTATWSHASNAH